MRDLGRVGCIMTRIGVVTARLARGVLVLSRATILTSSVAGAVLILSRGTILTSCFPGTVLECTGGTCRLRGLGRAGCVITRIGVVTARLARGVLVLTRAAILTPGAAGTVLILTLGTVDTIRLALLCLVSTRGASRTTASRPVVTSVTICNLTHIPAKLIAYTIGNCRRGNRGTYFASSCTIISMSTICTIRLACLVLVCTCRTWFTRSLAHDVLILTSRAFFSRVTYLAGTLITRLTLYTRGIIGRTIVSRVAINHGTRSSRTCYTRAICNVTICVRARSVIADSVRGTCWTGHTDIVDNAFVGGA